MRVLKQNGNYEKKFTELNVELKQAKDHYRKLQLKEREDQNLMKSYHEQIIKLEGQQRKLNQQILDKKKTLNRRWRQQNKTVETVNATALNKDLKDEANTLINFTLEDMKQLEDELRQVEEEKESEEQIMKDKISQQEV